MKVAIIGAGNVGKALTTSFTRAGHEVTIAAAHAEHARAAATSLGATAAPSSADAVAGADLVVLAVPATALASVATGCAECRRVPMVPPSFVTRPSC